jgi:hypothetical protein
MLKKAVPLNFYPAHALADRSASGSEQTQLRTMKGEYRDEGISKGC